MIRKFVVGVVRNGRKVFEAVGKKNGQKNQDIVRAEPYGRTYVPKAAFSNVVQKTAVNGRGYLVNQLARYARKNLASELRKQFSKSTIYREYSGLANKLSAFAFVGVGFAAYGNKEEEGFSAVCDHIKQLFQAKPLDKSDVEEDFSGYGLENYHLGPLGGIGSNSAVYLARLKKDDLSTDDMSSSVSVVSDDSLLTDALIESDDVLEDSDSSSFIMVEDQHGEDFDVVSGEIDVEESDVQVLQDDQDESEMATIMFSFAVGKERGTSLQSNTRPSSHLDNEFDLAIKMMFNYGIESNSNALFREMEKELIPAKDCKDHELLNCWENGHRAREKARLPPHPNIVAMEGAFVDDIPHLPEAMDIYPDALPPRLNPQGCGRNKTLFVVMKRYPYTLREYLQNHTPLPIDHSVKLLAQLVEAVIHLTNHGIAHRDLKSDNIFVDVHGDQCPHLVVSDFGECLSVGESRSLCVPYSTGEINKGGNSALMAPEIATACAGPTSVLDYRLSDLWAVGALAYEIFGADNPFCRTGDGSRLSSSTYREDELPSLPDVPMCLQRIVKMMLSRNPEQRPSPGRIVTLLHLFSWMPEQWLWTLTNQDSRSETSPCNRDVMRWLLNITAQALCQKSTGDRTVDRQLREIFLNRLEFEEVIWGIETLWDSSQC